MNTYLPKGTVMRLLSDCMGKKATNSDHKVSLKKGALVRIAPAMGSNMKVYNTMRTMTNPDFLMRSESKNAREQ